MNYLNKVLPIFFTCFSVAMIADDALQHICAHTNKSVVKFRHATLKKQSLDKLKHSSVTFDWPVDLCQFWISSLYGVRKDPSGKKKMHNGVDMAASKGTVVKSAATGKVKTVENNVPGYGNLVEVDHGKGFITRYAHLDRMHVKVGQSVKLGSKIGAVGSTGNVRGADPSHLHFEMIHNGHRVDPLHYLYWSERGYKKLKKNVY